MRVRLHHLYLTSVLVIFKPFNLPMLLSRVQLTEASRNVLGRQFWSRHSARCKQHQHLRFTDKSYYPTTPQVIRFHSTASHAKDGSSVNADEVSHFTGLAASWWDPTGPSRLLHLMNPLRHDFIKSCSPARADNNRSLTYLDVGCGGGIFASSAARLANTSKVVAIDPTPDVITVAREHQRNDPLLAQKGRISYINCAIEDLETQQGHIPKGGFDFVTVFEVVEHIDKPAAFLRQAVQHLKPGGWLIGSTIARHPLSYLTTKFVAEAPWPIGVVPRGTHDWNKY